MADSLMDKVTAPTSPVAESSSARAGGGGADSATLHHALRRATHAAHHELEQHPLLRPLLTPTLTLDDYGLVVDAFIDFFEGVEPALCAALSGTAWKGQDYRYLPRLPLLKRDRRDLSLSSGPRICQNEPWEFDEEDARLLGTLYVLEGATQGGRVIAPQLLRTLQLDADFGASYFYLHAQGQWQNLQLLLGECRYPDRAIEQAIATFARLRHCLDRRFTMSREGGASVDHRTG